MANERVVLCGGVHDINLPFESTPLRLYLDGPHKNVYLTIEDIHESMFQHIPAAFFDLVELATYVYCADQAVTRGGNGVRDFGQNWRRRLVFRIPVRCVDLWRSDDVQRELISTLSFLSEDEYEFEFEHLFHDSQVQEYLTFADEAADIPDEVMLFSGGLDSLSGAVDQAVVRQRRVCLVNHRSTPKVGTVHRQLLAELRQHAHFRPSHFRIRVNKNKGLGREHTQRVRSFLFAALGATISLMFGRDHLSFYENGIVSFNLPPSTQVIGARATRTTHPRVLAGFSRLFSLLAEKPFEVKNRFVWKTKTEIVQSIADAGCSDLIRYTRSCAHTKQQTEEHPHCGECSQCVDRRFAILAAGQHEFDSGDKYCVDLIMGERREGYPRTMLAIYVEMANQITQMDERAFFARYGEASRLLRSLNLDPEAAAIEIFRLYERHAKQVTQVVDAAIAQNVSALRKRTLPPHCLVQLVSSNPAEITSAPPPKPPAVPERGDYVLRKTGNMYEVRFAGGPLRHFKDSKGLQYLRMLVSQPHRRVSVVELRDTGTSKTPAPNSSRAVDHEFDPALIAQYKQEAESLQEELQEAWDNNDLGRKEELQQQLAWLAEEVRKSKNASPKAKRQSPEVKKAYTSVKNAIDRAIEKMKGDIPGLVQHFDSCLNLGSECIYSPPEGTVWET